MQRYLIFAGSEFYPEGGWADLKDAVADLGEVYYTLDSWREYDDWGEDDGQEQTPSSYKYDWVQVVDLQTPSRIMFEGTVEEVLYGLRQL